MVILIAVADIELGRLDPASFEHMANSLALRELGAGVALFGPGPDGGRDGYFEGEAPYPSLSERWSGRWYIQSKFHAPHLSKDAQAWLREQVQQELASFERPEREWPDNWIVVTNVDPSATPKTGTFDRTKEMVRKARPQLARRFHIWGAKKIRTLLLRHQDVQAHYGDFLTPGHVITELYEALKRDRAGAKLIIRHLTAGQLVNQRFAKLEQAGSTGQVPGLHHLFTDLPFRARLSDSAGEAVSTMSRAARRTHRPSADNFSKGDQWWKWRRHPSRARTWFIRGGPGQGKSTLGQYLAQLHRAWFLLEGGIDRLNENQRILAEEIRSTTAVGLWPTMGRFPATVELKDYAQWLSQTDSKEPRGVLTYLAARLQSAVQQSVSVAALREMLAQGRWLFIFDGLDEVPNDAKELIGVAVTEFLDEEVYTADADVFTICTSRPQGYSGQFDALDACHVDLVPLDAKQALRCAEPLLRFQRSDEDAHRDIQILTEATANSSVRELMTTPLQSHIMAVVVRSGGRPPERRWKLFENFYQVILRREANREGLDSRLLTVFKSHDDLLKTVHNRLGFALHASAETSSGAQSHMPRSEFEGVVRGAANDMLEQNIDATVDALMEATTDRLVLVNTPDDGNHVRFDVRQLQEFFAAEFLREYDPGRGVELRDSFEILGADPHWREVTHFLLSALVEGKKGSDIDALASVLHRFDSGPEQERMLWRRLARGALAALRLLSEGVLEQDRRVREQIRQTLSPVFASTSPDDVRQLSSVEQPQTQAWLTGVLIDALRESSLAESVGAAAALVQVLPDGHPRVQDVSGILSSAPPVALALIARLALREKKRPKWFLRLIGEIFRAPMNPMTVEAIGLIRQALVIRDLKHEGLYSDDWSDRECALVEWFMCDERPSESRDDATGDFSSFFSSDWSTSNPPKQLRPSGNGVADNSFLQVLDSIARFAESATHQNLCRAAENLSTAPTNVVGALPSHIGAWVPLCRNKDISANFADLKTITKTELSILKRQREFRGQPVGRTRWFNSSDFAQYDQKGLERLIGMYPTIALWASYVGAIRGLDEQIARRLCGLPMQLSRVAYAWGYLVKKVPQMERELRAAFHEAAQCPPVGSILATVSLRLKLPDDAVMIPHIAATFTADRDVRRHLDVPGEAIRSLAQKIAPVTTLRAVRDDAERRFPERLGAIALLWLHPKAVGFRETLDELPTIIETESLAWFAPLAIRALTLFGSPTDPHSVHVAAVIAEAIRDDFVLRDELNPLVAKWREISGTPAIQSGAASKWIRKG